MGSGSSKDGAAAGGAPQARTRGARALASPCFRRSATLEQFQEEEIARSTNVACGVQVVGESKEENCDIYQMHRPLSEMPSSTSADAEPSEEDQDRTLLNNVGAAADSSSATIAAFARPTSSLVRSQLCLGLIPDNIGFRLNRAASLGSSSAVSLLSDGLSVPTGDGGRRVHIDGNSSLEGNHTQDNAPVRTDSSTSSIRDIAQDDTSAAQSRIAESRCSYGRLGPQESLERSVRFSRTRSVGRLRDRVLRRNPFVEGLFTPSPLRSNARQPPGSTTRMASSSGRVNELQPDSSRNHLYQIANSTDGNSHRGSETLQLREATNRNLLEHRSAFLERRRRIRSQVRALQRLGSRFENLSGHDRSCVLSGHHQTSHCSCRTSNRAGNSDDEASTRASISRIVMLAEALFEVLDEIHQQSVALSSRPSFTSIGSVPAPKEAVDCLPVKVYKKSTKHKLDEVAQCYICLVEYEEGDCVRKLPCKHEFHQTCVDKWLKEIHRVCPLCRGDVCRPEASNIGKQIN